jgi:hypothetical protein
LFFHAPALNDAGQVAYLADLVGADVTSANDDALFLFDPILGGLLIAREGDPFDVGNGDLRTVANNGILVSIGQTDDTPTSLAHDGTLAFRLAFTDGTSGLFTASLEFTADFDSDGDVDGRDFLKWQRGESPSPLSAGDLADWQQNYGVGSLTATSVAVPKPGSLALLGIFIMATPHRRVLRLAGRDDRTI